MKVQESIEKNLTSAQYARSRPRPRKTRAKLWAGEFGGCPRYSMLRIRDYPDTIHLTAKALNYMRLGVVYESETKRAMEQVHGAQNIKGQMSLKTEHWSGKTDIVIFPYTNHPTIIEHKATGDKWWNYENSLPNPKHAMQLWLYGVLYEQIHGIRPKLILFYRSWGHHAEFEVSHELEISGFVDATPAKQRITLDPYKTKMEWELYYDDDVLPPILEDKEDGCNFNGKPSCRFYYHCWPDEST